MRALRFHRFGDPTVLQLCQVERPEPKAGEMLVRQLSTSVNFVDLMIRKGGYARLGEDILPYTGGRDAAGVVEEIGAGVDPVWLGQRIFGVPEMDRGSFADYVIVRPAEAAIAPRVIADADLGSVPLAALTAYQALHTQGMIAAGDRVLIHGGTGGVGHFAVQIAKAAGAEVVTTCATRNRDMALALGADEVLAYDDVAFEDHTRDMDLIFDAVGGRTLSRSIPCVRKGGRLISAVAEPDVAAANAHSLAVSKFFVATSSGEDLKTISTMMDKGHVKPVIGARFDLENLASAQSRLEQGGGRGKVGVVIAP